MWKGASGLAGGLLGMAADPVDAASGLYSMAEHNPILGPINPFKLAHGAYDLVAGNADLGEVANRTLNPLQSLRDDVDFTVNLGKGIVDPYIQSIKSGKP